MDNNDSGDQPFTVYIGEIALPRSVRFWLLLIFEIPSLTCSLFVLHAFITDRTLRKSLHHHSTIVLNIFGLLFKLIDVPLYLHFIIVGMVSPQTPATCLVWWLADLGFYYICCLLAAWISIERHIFIFHRNWLSTRTKRLFIHYLPPTAIVIYALAFYIWMIFFPPCENDFQYTLPVCNAAPCYLTVSIPNGWESSVHGCFTTLIIGVCSIGLLIRIVFDKRRRHHVIQWRKHRKLTIQLLFIASIFVIFNLPLNVGAFVQLCGLPFDLGAVLMPYFFFLSYWLIFLIPFVCLNSLPNLKQRVKSMFCIVRRYRAQVDIILSVRPSNYTMRP